MPSFSRQIILASGRNAWLSDDEVDYFACLLHEQFHFQFRETWKLLIPECMEPLQPNKRHIHLLHSSNEDFSKSDARQMRGGHWICIWFNGESIHVFDSSNAHVLKDCHKKFLRTLYPSIIDNLTIKFCTVQQQQNDFDCGAVAIAFGVSIAFGDNRERATYDVSKMRPHLLHMFETGTISKFPITPVPKTITPVPKTIKALKRSTSTSINPVVKKKILLDEAS